MARTYNNIPVPTPTKNTVPSADIRDAVFAGAKLDEAMTSQSEYYTDRLGVYRVTYKGFEVSFNNQMAGQNNLFLVAEEVRERLISAAIDAQISRINDAVKNSGYKALGQYENGPYTVTDYNQGIVYDGDFWKISPSVDLPYTTAGTTSLTWNSTDSVKFVNASDGLIRQDLASENGAALSGTTKGKNVQQMLDAVQGGGFDSLDVDGFHARIRQTGMYDLLEVPGSPKGSAGFTFGGKKNKGALVMDERARLQGYSFVNNRMVASQIAYPFAHGTGYFNGPFEQSLLHIPVKGAEDDSLHHKMLFGYDEETQRSFASVVSPLTYGEGGFPFDGFNEQVSRLGFYYDVGYGLNHSFDHFNTTDMAALRWGLICTIKPGSTGDSGKIFAADITTGSYVEYEPATYSLVVNGQNLIDTAKGGNLNRGNISQWIKFVRKEDTSNAALTMNFIPEVGIVYNTSTGNVDVYIKLPFNSPRPSITVKTLANPTYVTVDWSLWGTNALRSTEPGGITYAITYYPINTQNYVRSNGGEVLYTPNIALRVKDLLTQTSVYSSRHAQYIEYEFSSYGNYHATNKYAGGGITVTKNSTGNYTVNGCTLSGNRWKMKAPITWFGDRAAGIITITATGSGSFSFTLRKRAYIVNTTTATPTVTEGLGDFIDIPDGTWVDFHVTV